MPSVEYQALYRKYRPQTFGKVVGQAHITETLVREIAEDKVAHAYLFAGPRWNGKDDLGPHPGQGAELPEQAGNG